MNAFCNLLLLAAGGASILILPLWMSSQNSIGPDRIGGTIVCFFLLAARWMCMSIPLLRAASQGAFSSEQGGGGPGAALGMVAVYSILELYSFLCASEKSAGPFIILPILMPVTIGLYMFWWFSRGLAAPAPPWMRWAALGSTVGVMIFGLVVGGIITGIQEWREKDPAHIAEQDALGRRALYHMPNPNDSITQPLSFIGPDEAADLRAEALAALANRPNLIPELAQELERQNLHEASNAIRYMAQMEPAPPQQLLAPFRRFVEFLKQDIQEQHTDDSLVESLNAAIRGAHALQVNIRPELAEMAEALRSTDGKQAALTVIEMEVAK